MQAKKVEAYVRTQILKIWVANLLRVAVIATVAWVLLSKYFAQLGPKWLVVGAVTSLGFWILIQYLIGWWMKKAAKEGREKHPHLHARTESILHAICEMRRIPKPEVVLLSDLGDKKLNKLLRVLAAIMDRVGPIDLVLMGSSLVEKTNEEQLKGILAHEARHSNQPENLADKVIAFAVMILGGGAFTFGIWAYGFNVWDRIGFEGAAIAVLSACAFKALTMKTLRYIKAFISRATERKTDALSALDLGTPEPLISALAELHEEIERNPITPTQPALLRSHPTLEQRQTALRRLAA